MSKRMELELEIMGTNFVFDVEYVITSYGTIHSWYGSGDPPELYIDQVINKRTGEDMTDWLDKHHDWCNKKYKPWYQIVHYYNDRTIKLQVNVLTLLEVLRDKIYDLEEFDEGGDLGGYD